MCSRFGHISYAAPAGSGADGTNVATRTAPVSQAAADPDACTHDHDPATAGGGSAAWSVSTPPGAP